MAVTKENLVTSFRELTPLQKVLYGSGFLVLAFFIVALTVSLFIPKNDNGKTETGSEENISQNMADPSTQTEETGAAGNPDVRLDVEDKMAPEPPQPTSEVTFGETSLDSKEIRAVQQAALKGLEEFYRWDKGETPDERTARVSAVLSKDSDARDRGPDLKDIESYEDRDDAVISGGKVTTMTPAGGDRKLYRIVAGVTHQIQYTYETASSSEPVKSSVLNREVSLTVDMAHEDGKWKISAITEN